MQNFMVGSFSIPNMASSSKSVAQLKVVKFPRHHSYVGNEESFYLTDWESWSRGVMASPPPPCNCWSHLTNSPPILLSGAADSAQAQPPLLISSNQRLQRQIRNRESSARSRAKKQETLFIHFISSCFFFAFFCLLNSWWRRKPFLQACYNELEFKIARVMEDNSRLRRQIEEVSHSYLSDSVS